MLKSIINLGITNEVDSFTQKSIRLINAIALISVFAGLFGELYTLLVKGVIVAGVVQFVVSSTVMGLILYLNYKKQYKWARLSLLILCNLSLSAILLTIENGIGASTFHLINFVIYIGIVRELWKIVLWSILSIAIYLIGVSLNYYGLINPIITFPEESQLVFRIMFFLITILIIMLIVFSYRRENERIEDSLILQIDLNETLTQEVHHRVKNNLQIIISLLELQMDKSMRSESKAVLEECKNRVYAMYLVHNSLFLQEHNLPLATYLESLAANLESSFANQNIQTKLSLDSEIICNSNETVLVGIIVNELITNCYKHAFENNKKGIITIALKQIQNQIEIIVTDNGLGNNDMNSEASEDKLGLNLVRLIAKQLMAKISFKNDAGFVVSFTFEKTKSIE